MKRNSIQIIYLLFSLLLIISCKKDDSAETSEDLNAENRKGLGASSEDLLSDDTYTSLTVEFLYSGIYRPTPTALVNFRNFLDERLNKPAGINFVETVISESSGAPFTIEEIKAIEEEHRNQYTVGNNIAVFILFSNGNSASDTNTSVTLGTAYLNTSIVIYEKTLKDLVAANPLLDLSNIESVTLQHEFGHILGLVNLLGDDVHTGHEDPGHSRHCIVEDCLMYFESNLRSQVIERFSRRNSVLDFDPLCIEDLQAKGGL